MIDINITLLIQMANFLVLVFLLNMVLYRPIRKRDRPKKSGDG